MSKSLNFSIILSAIDRASSVIGGAVSKAKGHLQALERSRGFQNMDTLGNKALIAGGLITAGFGMAVHAAEESEVATAKLEQVFRSMGETTGTAARQAEEYASKLSMQIGVEDEIIMLTQTKLATFSAVSNEVARANGIFDRTTAAAHDLAAAGFGDAASNAAQLGKAMQDPIKGLASLRKAGVTFTDAERNKIKVLVESGNLLEAQKLVLGAIEKQVGGVAAAGAPASAKFKVAMGEMWEAIGKLLLPIVEKFTAFLTNTFIPAFQKFVEEHPGVVKAVAAIGAGLLAFGIAVKMVTTVVGIMNAVLLMNPIVLIATLIIGLAVAMLFYWSEVKKFFGKFMEWFKGWGKYVVLAVMPFLAVPLLIIAYWDKIKAFFSNLFNDIRQKFVDWVNWVFGIPGRVYQAGVNIVNSIWDGMKAAWNGLIGWFEDKIQGIRDYLPFSPAKVGPLKDIHKLKFVETIAQSIKPGKLTGVMQQTALIAKNTLMDAASKPSIIGGGGAIAANATAGGGTGGMVINFSPTINLAGGGNGNVKEDILVALRNNIPELINLVEEGIRRKSRGKY